MTNTQIVNKGADCINIIHLLAAIEVLYGHTFAHLEIDAIPVLGDFIHFFHGVPIFFKMAILDMVVDRTVKAFRGVPDEAFRANLSGTMSGGTCGTQGAASILSRTYQLTLVRSVRFPFGENNEDILCFQPIATKKNDLRLIGYKE